ncbi:preprotein translocase subunit SecE [Salinisphaera sp. USBA-960]|uniref:preprotein translocase subunit SecE n=1 Tax=Salinisphaera orenii TaxID=856731 RepID=UPI000DBE9C48|nr:preprotein translocase subunit SecE [Salifodinibacter halophilus]NNC26705.1 preprotein translocase subunit SecE [Salifodinibacter halophilus]
MATQDKQASSWLDAAIMWVAVAIVVASIVGYYYFTWYSDLVRVLGMIVGVGVAVLVAVQSQFGRIAWGYVQGSRTEVRRVVWPTRKETVQTTAMVVLVVLILAVFIWALDILLGWSVSLLTGRL